MKYTPVPGSAPPTTMYTTHPLSVEVWDVDASELASSLSLIPDKVRVKETSLVDIPVRSSEAALKSVFYQVPLLLQNLMLMEIRAQKGNELVEAEWLYEPSGDQAFIAKGDGVSTAVKVQDSKKPDFVLEDKQYEAYSFVEMKRP